MATTIRAPRVLAVALLLVLVLFPALPRHAAQAQDGLSEAQALMDDARSRSGDLDPLVDDESFTFEQDATDVSFETLADEVVDFYATYTIIVPRDGVDEPYDHGIEFRSNGDEFFQFIILSSSEDATRPVWGVLTATDLIAEGELPRRVYNTEPGEVNVVELAVVGEKAAFAVNGDVVGLVELVGGLATGAVALNTGITNMGTVPGGVVEFEGVSLWALDDGAPPDGPTADGEVYRGENFDWSITLGDAWSLEDDDTSGGEDWAWFSNGVSDISIFAYEDTETPATCITDEIDYLDSQSNFFSDATVATNLDGEDLIGTSPDGTYEFAVLWATNVLDDGTTEPVTLFLRCQELIPGEALLYVRQVVASDDYNAEIPARAAFLDGLEIGAPADGVNPDDAVATEDAGDERPSTRDETPTPAADDAVVVTLDPLEGNADGEATLSPSGSRTIVEVVADAPEGTLVSIQEGSCDDLAGEEAYAAGELDENGESSARVRATIDDLEGLYVITLVDAETLDFANPLACGEI